MRRHLMHATLALSAAILCVAAAGCSFLDHTPDLQTVSDAGGLFHVKIPSDWSSQVTTGLIAVYGAKEPPASGKLDDLSIGIFVTRDTTETPVPDALEYVVALRAKERSWKNAQISEPTNVTIGKRDGSVVSVSGTDAQGVEFVAEYYFIRTSGQEVLVIAAAPKDRWPDVEEDVRLLITDRWFWQISADQAQESTTTP